MVHAWKSARIIVAIAIELCMYVSEQETMVSEIAQTDNFNDKTNIKVVGRTFQALNIWPSSRSSVSVEPAATLSIA